MKSPFLLQAKFSSPIGTPYTSRISDSLQNTFVKYFAGKRLLIKYILITTKRSRLSKEVPEKDGDGDVLA